MSLLPLLVFSVCSMSEYHLTPPATFPSFAVQEAKEKRRKVLDAVRQRRRVNYLQFMKKRRLQAGSNLVTMV